VIEAQTRQQLQRLETTCRSQEKRKESKESCKIAKPIKQRVEDGFGLNIWARVIGIEQSRPSHFGPQLETFIQCY